MKKEDTEIEEIKKFRKQFYNEHANDYDNMWWNDGNALEEFAGFKNVVKIKPGDIVLDIATGTGTFLIEMAKLGATCYGIDQSSKMLEKLRYKVKQKGIEKDVEKISEGTAEKLPYPDRIFNWVVCIGMLEYYPLEYAKAVLLEIIRVLKPEGHCFIDIPNPNKPYAQEREWIFSYHLEKFEQMIKSLEFKILARNNAGYMLQYLLFKP
ncbi:MAG: class I SAM-dependent methyltransferase [Promethearchaeota archaeon]|jgi:ubiquinone/menaquinone biosynthesis C-methylase UbiE